MEVILDLDTSKFNTKEEAHAYLKEAFHFPSYYGNNLDALNDSLYDLEVSYTVVIHEEGLKELVQSAYGYKVLKVMNKVSHHSENIKIKLV